MDRPIFVAKNVFSSEILDICWNFEGTRVFVVSYDGELCTLSLSIEEIIQIVGKQNFSSTILNKSNQKNIKKQSKPSITSNPIITPIENTNDSKEDLLEYLFQKEDIASYKVINIKEMSFRF